MSDEPSLAIRLFGTDEPVEPPRVLAAGPLTAELEAGNLRYVRWRGIEVMRAISFIVRDRDWGTYNPVISGLEVEEGEGRFAVRYRARAADDAQAFAYEAEITGEASGRLVFSGRGRAETDFLTNRTGFVILHPLDGVAGEPAGILHVDGREVEGRFPAVIDPVQPMMELRRLTHTAANGALRIACLMEGDTYEMEDQRNWTDASYKTYVRPLALPWPYTIAKGEGVDQSVTLTVEGDVAAPSAGAPVRIEAGAASGATVPPLGLGLDPDDTAAAGGVASQVAEIGARHLVCHLDPRRGHGRATLAAQIELARAIGAEPWLEAVIASVEGFEAEIAALGQVVADLGSPFPVVLLSPAPDLKCTLPGSPWPPVPPAAAMFDAARAAFPGVRLGGGMFSYFTELNRKRPPLDRLDLVSFTTSALVHAGDDRSVMETIQTLPSIALSAREIAGRLPFAVGPSAIGMRDNPYGAAAKENPGNIRQAMNRNDPRQRGLLGAAWALGYFARFAEGGAAAIALGSPVGAAGAVAAEIDLPQPFFEGRAGGLYPVFHVLRGLARLAGAPLVPLKVSQPDRVQGVAAETPSGREIWLANLTGAPLEVDLASPIGSVAVLAAEDFVAASADPAFLDRTVSLPGGRLRLDPYAVVRVLAGS